MRCHTAVSLHYIILHFSEITTHSPLVIYMQKILNCRNLVTYVAKQKEIYCMQQHTMNLSKQLHYQLYTAAPTSSFVLISAVQAAGVWKTRCSWQLVKVKKEVETRDLTIPP